MPVSSWTSNIVHCSKWILSRNTGPLKVWKIAMVRQASRQIINNFLSSSLTKRQIVGGPCYYLAVILYGHTQVCKLHTQTHASGMHTQTHSHTCILVHRSVCKKRSDQAMVRLRSNKIASLLLQQFVIGRRGWYSFRRLLPPQADPRYNFCFWCSL